MNHYAISKYIQYKCIPIHSNEMMLLNNSQNWKGFSASNPKYENIFF